MTIKKVAICGGGPAARFAAQACKDNGVKEVHCYSFTKGRAPSGSFWFHDLPPSLGQFNKEPILVFPEGTPEGYHRKQYGPDIPMAVSSFPLNVGIPQLKHGYNPTGPWKEMEKAIDDWRFDRLTDNAVERLGKSYDLVLSTIPRKSDKDRFPPVAMFPAVSLPADIMKTPSDLWSNFLRGNQISPGQLGSYIRKFHNRFPTANTALIIYSGEDKHPWIRLSLLHDKVTVEYPIGFKVQSAILRNFQVVLQPTLTPEHKPLTGDELFDENVYLIGRFATWDRHLLSHQVYSAVCGILSDNTTSG